MTRRLDDLPRFPLREHGSPERVERIWRRLAPEVGTTSTWWTRPQTWWAPATLVVVFGAGIFVGARWVRPDNTPVLSAERPAPVEATPGQQAPRPMPAGAPNVRPRVVPPHRGHSPGAILPVPAPVNKLVPPAASVAPAATVPVWERLAESGDFEAARAELESHGGFESVLGTARASELMTLVDIARSSGSRAHAIAALRRVVESFRDAPEAPLAAWTLGNLLDQSGDETGAASAYALYRRLSPGGDFAEDALAREIDSALSLGNLELSARLIAQYENEFPNGRSLEEYRAELARRADRANAAANPGSDANAPAEPEAVHDAVAPKPVRNDDAPSSGLKPSQK